jgi:hypothetical protein
MIAAPMLQKLNPGSHNGIVVKALRHACATAVHEIATHESARQPGVLMPLKTWLDLAARRDNACLDPDALATLFRALARWQSSVLKKRRTGPFKPTMFGLAERAEQAWTWAYALTIAAHGAAAEEIVSGVVDHPLPSQTA